MKSLFLGVLVFFTLSASTNGGIIKESSGHLYNHNLTKTYNIQSYSVYPHTKYNIFYTSIDSAGVTKRVHSSGTFGDGSLPKSLTVFSDSSDKNDNSLKISTESILSNFSHTFYPYLLSDDVATFKFVGSGRSANTMRVELQLFDKAGKYIETIR